MDMLHFLCFTPIVSPYYMCVSWLVSGEGRDWSGLMTTVVCSRQHLHIISMKPVGIFDETFISSSKIRYFLTRRWGDLLLKTGYFLLCLRQWNQESRKHFKFFGFVPKLYKNISTAILYNMKLKTDKETSSINMSVVCRKWIANMYSGD